MGVRCFSCPKVESRLADIDSMRITTTFGFPLPVSMLILRRITCMLSTLSVMPSEARAAATASASGMRCSSLFSLRISSSALVSRLNAGLMPNWLRNGSSQ